MESRVKVMGHPVHQILVMFPIGALAFSTVFDGLQQATGDRSWGEAGRKSLGAGLLSALVAAPFGLIDWMAIPEGTRARRIGALHGIGNLGMLGLFAASWLTRQRGGREADRTAFALSAGGLALSGVTAWLGTELVNRLGVGVDDDAQLDASNSIEHAGVVHVGAPHLEREARG